MLKKMLHTFAAKFLTLAMVMVALAPLVGNDATNAAPTLMAPLQAEAVQLDAGNGNLEPSQNLNLELQAQEDNTDPVIDSLPLQSTPSENPPQVDLPLSNVGPTLKIGVNIPEGGYEVLLGKQNQFSVVKEGYNGKCGKEGPYYTCGISTLAPGGYVVKFKDVPGFTTPPQKPVDLDGFDDLVIGIYEKSSVNPDEPKGPYLKVGVNIPEGGFEVLQGNGGNFNTVYNQLNNAKCPVEGGYYTCEVKTLAPGGYVVKFKDVPGYTTPSQKPVDLDGLDDLVLGVYVKKTVDDGSLTFNVRTQDNQGNALNEQYVRNALTTHTTPDTFSEKLANLNYFTFQFKNKPGYTTPGTVVVNNKIINSLPANVTILENGSTYALGTALKANATYTIIGTYVKQADNNNAAYTVTKQAIDQQVYNDGNKRVTYQITVTRNANGPTGTYSIVVDDTVNDNNRTLYGTNGGTMKVVPVNGNYSTCSNGCGDITAGPVTVTTTQPGNVTMTYVMVSDNKGIPTGQSSSFTNTAVGNYWQDGQNKTTSDKETVTVNKNGENNNDGDLFTVDKQVTSEQTLADGNKRVTYQLTVRRNANGPTGTYYVLVDDTINDNGNRTLYGSNGGTLKVVQNSNGTYSTCSNNCGDITAGPVNVKTTYTGEVITMTYNAITDNSTIVAGQTSSFTNTVVARYTQDGQTKSPSDQVTVTATKSGSPVPPAPTPTPLPPTTPRTGNGLNLLVLLAISALGALGWQKLERRMAAAKK